MAWSSRIQGRPQNSSANVGNRFFEDELTADPAKWIAAQLADITGLLERCGASDLVPSVDLDEHRRALPMILAAVNTCLARVPVAISASRGARV
jgi:hypothetical protein